MPALLVAGAAVAVYLTALPGAFVGDALIAIAQNRGLLESQAWLVWFARDYFWGSALQDPTLYRPLTVLSYLAQLRTTGAAPVYFVALNVLLHAAVSLLVLRLGTTLVGRPAAVAGALLFAVHPIHAEAVAWIMGRAELLAALFGLTACACALRATRLVEPRRAWLIGGAMVGYLAALLAKEHVVLLPLWFGLVWLVDRPNRSGRAAAVLGVGSAAALAGFLLLRTHALTRELAAQEPAVAVYLNGLFNPASVVSAPYRWLTATAVVWRYAGLLVWPARLSHDYSYAEIPASTGLGGAEASGALLVVGLLVAIGLAGRRAPGLALALALVPVTFGPVSNFPFAIGTIMGERLAYLPSVGLSLVTGWVGMRFAALGTWRGRVAVCALVVVTLALAVRTMVRGTDWRDNYTLYTRDLRAAPRSAHLHTNAALQELQRGDPMRAMALIQEALRIYPNSFMATEVLAQIHSHQNELGAAAEQYRRAIALVPNHPRFYTELGRTLLQAGHAGEAESAFRDAIRVAPRGAVQARLHLGGLLVETGRPAEGFREFAAATRLAPRDPALVFGLARAALALGDRRAAAAYARRAAAAGFPVPGDFWRLTGGAS